MRLKLDAMTIAALALGAKNEVIAWDTTLPRFGLRLQRRHSDGKVLKRFIVQYRVRGGRKPRLTRSPNLKRRSTGCSALRRPSSSPPARHARLDARRGSCRALRP
jgi:hypothetical protein